MDAGLSFWARAPHRGWHDSPVIWLERAVEFCPHRNDPMFDDLIAAYKEAMEYHNHVLEKKHCIGRGFTEQTTFALTGDKKQRKRGNIEKL